MFIQIDFEADTPIYIQIKEQIIRGIAKGELTEGDNLPSVRQLASDIGINLHTVNKAYNLLKTDNYISMDRRKGAVINPKEERPTLEFLEALKEQLKTNIAGVICKGMKEEEYINICSEIFNEYLGGKNNE